ncbi:MAG: O-antigen ligase family protein [Thermoanaerobaculia bacterium]
MSLASRLSLPEDIPKPLLAAILCYLGHILLQSKPAGSELGVAWMFIFLLSAMARRQIRPVFHILCFPLAVYALMSTISSIVATRDIHGNAEFAMWCKILVFPAALMIFRTLPEVRTLAIYCHAICGIWIACAGLFQYFFERQRDLEHRITGASTHVMTYSGLLLPLSLFLIILALHYRKPWMVASSVVVTLTLLLTFTRSAWLGWLAAIFVLMLLTRPRWVVFAVPILTVGIALLPMSLFSRAVSSFDTRQSSNLDRIRMVQAGIEMIRDYPLLGVGPANVKEIYPLYRASDAPRFRPPHLHNNVVQIWAERGVVALASYFLLLGLFFRECARGWRGPGRPFAEIGVAVTVAMFFAGLFEFNFGDTEPFFLLLDLFALVIASLEGPPPVLSWPFRRPSSPLANEAVPAAVRA